jgi:MFS family permease
VLLPHLVKDELHASASALGLVYASIAVGSIVAALAYGRLGLTSRFVLVMYGCWGLALLMVAGYGIAGNVAQLVAFGFIAGVGIAFGQGTWGTMMQRLVPRAVLGRVTSLDWLVSTSLMPMWFVVIGLIADGAGVRSTLVAAGLIGGITTILFPFLITGVREPERDGAIRAGHRGTTTGEVEHGRG